ncbi:MAG: hypothetical protein ISS84_00980 [Candidatus Pacebacteria bacterium]|nr:hypothetical protein [Candidatus Paceibacterota bacterium]
MVVVQNQNSRKYNLNFNYFKKWSPKRAYILGYIFAEGNINISKNRGHRGVLQIESKDKDILYFINKELGKNIYPTYRKRIREGRKNPVQESFYITICSKEIINDLTKIGVPPGKKSGKIKFPSLPKKYTKHFIKGYFDGDGSIFTLNQKRKYKNKIYSYFYKYLTFKSKSLKFLKELNKKLNFLGKIYPDCNEAYLLRFYLGKAEENSKRLI